MMNGFDHDDDFQTLLSNAIFGVDSLRHMQYQRKDGEGNVLVPINAPKHARPRPTVSLITRG